MKDFIRTYYKSITISIFLLLTVLIPLLLNISIGKYPGGIADNPTWLLFWGTWLGAIFGGIVTIIGVFITLKENRKDLTKTLKENKEQFEETIDTDRKRYEDNRRLSLMPHIKLRYIHNNKSEQDIHFRNEESAKALPNIRVIPLTIGNIGIGSAINITFQIENTIGKITNTEEIFKTDLGVNESQVILLYIELIEQYNYKFELNYEDVLGKYKYKQVGEISILGSKKFNINMTQKDYEELK